MSEKHADSRTARPAVDAASGKRASIAGKTLFAALLAVFIFSVGVGVGDGRISFGRHSNATTSSSPSRLDYTSVNEVYDKLRANYDGNLDGTKLLDGMKKGLAEATGDPYTEYLTASDAQDFKNQLNGGGFSGIGAELGQDADKNLIVVSPIEGAPAAKAGLKAQDIIAGIDGKSTSGFSIDEAVGKIRGKKGTTVDLKIVRNHSQTLDLKIVRDDIQVPSVSTKMLDADDSGNAGIGYMRINEFGDDTGTLAAQEAQKLKDQGAKRIILDLRGNPGGEVDSAVKVASLWLPNGKLIMQAKRGNQVLQTYTANGNNILQNIPTAVLVDGGSASASEIVASALHDDVNARIIGVQSFGKGVMQGIEPLANGAQLKVTIASWYRPNGQNINKKGITPDQVVKPADANTPEGQDPQLQAAQSYLDK